VSSASDIELGIGDHLSHVRIPTQVSHCVSFLQAELGVFEGFCVITQRPICVAYIRQNLRVIRSQSDCCLGACQRRFAHSFLAVLECQVSLQLCVAWTTTGGLFEYLTSFVACSCCFCVLSSTSLCPVEVLPD